jgi:hypothetical protein
MFGLSIIAWIFWLQFGVHFQILGEFLFKFLVTSVCGTNAEFNEDFFIGKSTERKTTLLHI